MDEHLILAYLAGVMDSDGYITLRRHSPNPLYPDSVTYSEEAGVGQTSDAAVPLFAERWGGRVVIRRRPTDGDWRPMFYWRVASGNAERCIRDLRPYLRVKAAQADLLLELSDHKRDRSHKSVRVGVRATRLTDEAQARREDLWRSIRRLNDRRRTNAEL